MAIHIRRREFVFTLGGAAATWPLAAGERNGGLLVPPDAITTARRELIIVLAARYGLPAVYPFRFFVTSGGLMSYGPDTPVVAPVRDADEIERACAALAGEMNGCSAVPRWQHQAAWADWHAGDRIAGAQRRAARRLPQGTCGNSVTSKDRHMQWNIAPPTDTPTAFPELAAELVRFGVDLIVVKEPAAIAAKNANGTIPVVMASVGEPLLVSTASRARADEVSE